MDWTSHLIDVSRTLFQSEDLLQELKDDKQDWLGFAGASDTEIQIQEQRLGVNLPTSYKEFLKISNGFKQLNCFIWDIFPIEKVDWLKNSDPDFYKLYSTEFASCFNATNEEYFVYGKDQRTTDFRSEYLINSLAISGWGDAAILLLNPHVKFGDEWEAWMFAVWHHGPVRYKSFEELMKEEYSSYLELLEKGE